MTVAQQIVKQVETIGTDRVFTIADLNFPDELWENVRVKLGRMVKAGKLVKLAPGKYYQPRVSILGPVPPSNESLVQDLLYTKEGDLDGYITTYSVWDAMGLTTQFSSTIVIGLNYRKDAIVRDGRKVQFLFQPNRITKETIPLLQILDSVKFIKLIPDANIDKSTQRLAVLIRALEMEQLDSLAELALNYPPRVRAITGALLESIGRYSHTQALRKSLNPLTEYRIGVSEKALPTKQNWRIV